MALGWRRQRRSLHSARTLRSLAAARPRRALRWLVMSSCSVFAPAREDGSPPAPSELPAEPPDQSASLQHGRRAHRRRLGRTLLYRFCCALSRRHYDQLGALEPSLGLARPFWRSKELRARQLPRPILCPAQSFQQRPQLVFAAVPLDQIVQAGPPVVLPPQHFISECGLLEPLYRELIVAGCVGVHDARCLTHRKTDHPVGMARVRSCRKAHQRFIVGAIAEPIAD